MCEDEINLFGKLARLLKKIHILKGFSVYGEEAWTVKKQCTNELEEFEMWTYRWVLKVSWNETITNQEVLDRMSKQQEVVWTILILGNYNVLNKLYVEINVNCYK